MDGIKGMELTVDCGYCYCWVAHPAVRHQTLTNIRHFSFPFAMLG
jgi:hypothetical protein